MKTLQETRKEFQDAGQGHVFQFYDSLSKSQQDFLLSCLQSIDIQRVNRIFAQSTRSTTKLVDTLAPLPGHVCDSTLSASPDILRAWEEQGLRLIAQNKVGIILLAGGQGTRLGSSAPKGCYDIQLPSHKSLFQLQGERILRLQEVSLARARFLTLIIVGVRVCKWKSGHSLVRHDVGSHPRSNRNLL